MNGSGNRIITGCIAHPTAGAMGYHYFNKELIDDLVVDVLQPEGLVYAPGADGNLKLVAVEWVVPGPNSNPPGVSEPPSVLGMQMHILVPAVGFYIHACLGLEPQPGGDVRGLESGGQLLIGAWAVISKASALTQSGRAAGRTVAVLLLAARVN